MGFFKNVFERIGYFIAGIASLLYGLVIFIMDPKFGNLFKNKWYHNPLLCLLFAIGSFMITFSKRAPDAKKEKVADEKKSENLPG